MRRINLKDDFRKLATLISQGKFGELKTRILQITPGINRIRSKFIIKQLHRKYSKFVELYPSKYNLLMGGGA